VLKSEGTSGFQTRVVIQEVRLSQCEYVTNVSIDLNAPNGAYITKRTVSGVV
jgi:hypothetical protein